MTGDVEKSYKALVWAHYHTMFKDQMLTKRKVENLVWPLNPRQVFGASIKYDKVRENVGFVYDSQKRVMSMLNIDVDSNVNFDVPFNLYYTL